VDRNRCWRVSGGGGVAGQPPAEGGADGVGENGEYDVEVDVEGNGAGESVLAERADGFGESLFDVHASGVGLDHVLDRWGAVVTQDGGVVVAEAGDGELPQPGRGSR
jgi:hypothetical protein